MLWPRRRSSKLRREMDVSASLTYKRRYCNCRGGWRVNVLAQPADPGTVEVDLDRYLGPAWIIDLDSARITATNAAGRPLWREFLKNDRTLDHAMPAFWVLRRLTTDEEIHTLIFWSGPSSLSLRCACRRIAPGSCRIVVAVVDSVSGRLPMLPLYAAPSAGPAPIDDRMTRATLAHELRTPLSAIMALAEVMKDERLGAMGNARYLVYASDIYDSARHALSVLGAMLGRDLGEPFDSEPADVDVEETVRKCLSGMHELARQATVQLTTDFGQVGHLAIDRRSLTQILLNLISNALKFTPPGGSVTISTRSKPDGSLELSVLDTGAGIPQADIDRLLSLDTAPASTLLRHGTGFGLPLVKALAGASGGTVAIESEPGHGTRVSITYPRERLRQAPPPAA